MTFQQKKWVDRQSEYPNRRILTPTGTPNEYEVSRSEGLVIKEGDLLDSDNLNGLEKRIGDAFNQSDKDINNLVVGSTAAADGILTATALKNGIEKLTVLGKSHKSKNLLEYEVTNHTIDGVTFTINDDKSVTVNGTATQNTFLYLTNTLKLQAGSYVLDAGVSVDNETRMQVVDVTDYNLVYAMTKSSKTEKFTLEKDVIVRVVVRIGNGYTANNLTFYPMIRLASKTDDTYEPFGIHSVGDDGSTELTVSGKNLLPQPYYSKNSYGLQWECKNGLWRVYGTTNDPYPRVSLAVPLTLYAGRYTSTPVFVKGSIKDVANAVRICNSKATQYIQQTTGTVAETTEFTTLIFGNIPVGTAIDIEFYLMIEVGSVSTEYEPYKGKQDISLPISLNGIPVSSGGNYTDENGQQWLADTAEIQNGVVTVTRNVKSMVLKGTEDWLHPDWMPITQMFQVTVPMSNRDVACICSHLNGQKGSVGGGIADNSILVDSSAGYGYMYVRFNENSELDTVDKFKTYLTSNPMTVLFALETPTTETYGIEEITNAGGVLNIIQPDGAGLVADISGAASAEYLERVKQEALEAANNAQTTADAAMPKNGGAFTDGVQAYLNEMASKWTIKNNTVVASDWNIIESPAQVIVFVRK